MLFIDRNLLVEFWIFGLWMVFVFATWVEEIIDQKQAKKEKNLSCYVHVKAYRFRFQALVRFAKCNDEWDQATSCWLRSVDIQFVFILFGPIALRFFQKRKMALHRSTFSFTHSLSLLSLPLFVYINFKFSSCFTLPPPTSSS